MANLAALILDKAGDLISAPGAWTQFNMAKDKYDMVVEVNSPNAVSWCAVGAIRRIEFLAPRRGAVIAAVEQVLEKDLSMIAFNDMPGRTQEEVVSLFRNTAEKIREGVLSCDI